MNDSLSMRGKVAEARVWCRLVGGVLDGTIVRPEEISDGADGSPAEFRVPASRSPGGEEGWMPITYVRRRLVYMTSSETPPIGDDELGTVVIRYLAHGALSEDEAALLALRALAVAAGAEATPEAA